MSLKLKRIVLTICLIPCILCLISIFVTRMITVTDNMLAAGIVLTGIGIALYTIVDMTEDI